jgi:Tol biopolymer transport system component
VTNYSTGAGAAQLSLSNSGSIAYLASGAAERALVWADRKGQMEEIAAPPRPYIEVAMAPGGDRAAVNVENGTDLDIWAYEFERGTLTRITFGGNNESPVWTPDGQRVAFAASVAGRPQTIMWIPADGNGAAEELAGNVSAWQWPVSFSPDGRLLTLDVTSAGTDYDIWVLPLDGERKARPLVRTPYDERQARFSPDGRYIAYQSEDTGKSQIYVQAYPGPGAKRQVSTEGGFQARWSRSGREIVYRSGDRNEKMIAVDIETRPELRIGKPRLLFEARGDLGLGGYEYDLAPDGQRFIIIKAGPRESQQAHLELVLNWFDELRRRVPSGKQ